MGIKIKLMYNFCLSNYHLFNENNYWWHNTSTMKRAIKRCKTSTVSLTNASVKDGLRQNQPTFTLSSSLIQHPHFLRASLPARSQGLVFQWNHIFWISKEVWIQRLVGCRVPALAWSHLKNSCTEETYKSNR